MLKNSKIFIAGHAGLLGSAICRKLKTEGYSNVIVAEHKNLELRNEAQVRRFISSQQPEYVFMCAAIVGGIGANMEKPVDFLLGNLQIQNNMVAASLGFVQKLMFFGSSCIYPRECPQPLKENSLFSGPLEPTNQWYALAKLTGLKLCEAFNSQYSCNFITVIPCNLYGIDDNYDPTRSHVIPALIRRLHEGKKGESEEVKPWLLSNEVRIWGHPETRREFLFADDLADACVLLMDDYTSSKPINVGYGSDISIFALVKKIRHEVGLPDDIKTTFDYSKPVGMPSKLLNCSRIQDMGWSPRISIEMGLHLAYLDFLKRYGTEAKTVGEKSLPGADRKPRRKVQTLR